VHDASNIGPLTLGDFYEVLLRLPTKDLYRLHIVCRPWRFLLLDLHFAATHAVVQSHSSSLATWQTVRSTMTLWMSSTHRAMS
jgi:hypothetical protein